MTFSIRRVLLSVPPVLVAASTSASAHHVMGGRTPSTFVEGLLSGLAHPVIGLDHLAFIVAVGLIVAFSGLPLAMPAIFIGASMLGVLFHVAGMPWPGVELLVAASLLVAGFLIARGRPISGRTLIALFAIAGLVHGYAYGESIYGAEATPVWAYLVGLALIQTAIAVAAALVVRAGLLAASIAPRLAGASVAAIGLVVLAVQLLAA